MKQKTLKDTLTFRGIGLHTGKTSEVKISPAEADQGFFFLKDGGKIRARADQVESTKRGLRVAGVLTVEHLLAALAGLGADNAQIEVFGEEIPILDGSALPFVEAIKKAGLVEQKKDRDFLSLSLPLAIESADESLMVSPHHRFEVEFMIDFPVIGAQKFVYADNFEKEIAPARTFGFLEELEELRQQGLALGASADNALAITKTGYATPARFKDEPVRHKILDLIGDFTLLGRPLKAKVAARKTGHKANIEMVRRILCST